MYINNLRNNIKNLNDYDRELFISAAYGYQVNQLHKNNLKKAHFNTLVDNFVKGKSTQIALSTIDSYLYGLDQVKLDGARDAFFKNQLKEAVSWRQLFIKLTSDLPMPKEVNQIYFDEDNLRIVKSILKGIPCCANGGVSLRRGLLLFIEVKG